MISNQYETLLRRVYEDGIHKSDRTGTGTRSIFGHQMRFDLSEGFPLITTKKLHTRSIFTELLWFLNGDTNTRFLHENGVTIWDEWADENGDLGRIYGAQWRGWRRENGAGIDQIQNVINQIKFDKDSRRMIVTAWNPAEIDDMALPPCHCLFQFYVANGRLSCQLYQRSADVFLGVPFNIASYALLTHIIADQTDLDVGDFVWTGGDCHLYENHLQQAELQISRTPRAYPTLKIKRKAETFDDYRLEDFEIIGYNPYDHIPAPVAV